MLIKGDKLRYQFISLPSGKISDEWSIIKTSSKDNSKEKFDLNEK